MSFASKKIDYFIAVAQEGSLTKAALRKFVTVSPVCRLISELESELGVALFYREGKGMKLTSEGENFYNDIISPYLSITNIEKKLRTNNTLRIDVRGPFPVFIEDICQHFFKPEMKKLIKVSRTNDKNSGKLIDDYEIIYSTDKINVSNSYHTISSHEDVSLLTCEKLKSEDLRSLPFIQSYSFASTDFYKKLHNKFSELGYSNEVISIENEDIRKEAVAQGFGISIVTPSFIRYADPVKFKFIQPDKINLLLPHHLYIKSGSLIDMAEITELLKIVSSLEWVCNNPIK